MFKYNNNAYYMHMMHVSFHGVPLSAWADLGGCASLQIFMTFPNLIVMLLNSNFCITICVFVCVLCVCMYCVYALNILRICSRSSSNCQTKVC